MPILRTREADFNDLVKVCHRIPTEHPVLFEIFMDGQYYEFFSGKKMNTVKSNSLEELELILLAFHNAGFVYGSIHGSEFGFPRKEQEHGNSISINDGAVISDWDSFRNYNWMDPDHCDYSKLQGISGKLPDKMKLLVMGPGGVLENVTALIGYDNMCYMLYEDPELLQAVFDKVGSTLLRYYENSLEYDSVGGIISNDDWGFNTQTFLSVSDMRKYVFPWHKKIVEAAHKKGKFAILHSCGYMNDVFDDIIDDMKFDAKHSYEDNIFSVEKSYEKWGNRIAILGGLDLNFLISASMDEMVTRATALVQNSQERGGYALGSGNSLCFYLPEDKVIALLNIANQYPQ
ncbi:MAG: uroporphyrinogen decarboxylase family protein [Oscillospiraceae bacterium]